jgi:Arc/MetJ-type ribon-helix-helix transcriptional regulator
VGRFRGDELSTATEMRLSSCIPKRYHLGMSTQIAVRLPDELVAYVDRAVAEGRVRSRAELVTRLIERDARRQRAEEDLAVLLQKGVVGDPAALAIARATASTPIAE